MKRVRVVSLTVALAVVSALLVVSVPALAQRGRGGGARGGGRGAPAAAVPAAMEEVANRLVALINAGDADGLSAMAMADAIYMDEDGHAPPASVWVGRITDTPVTMAISGLQGQTWGSSGWVGFNYTLEETYQDQQVTLDGIASIVLEQVDGNWMIRMVHGALKQNVSAFAN